MSDAAEQEFLSRGELTWGNATHPATLRGSYHRFQPNSLRFTLMSEQPEVWSNIAQHGGILAADFLGTTDNNESVWLSGLGDVSTTFTFPGVKVEGRADLFAKGDFLDFEGSQGSTRAMAFIPPVPALIPSSIFEYHPGGAIVPQPSDGSAIRWRTSLGEAVLTGQFDYVPGQIGSEESIQRVKRHAIEITVDIAGTNSLKTLVSNLSDALDEPLWILSFLARRRVVWHSAEAEFISDQSHNTADVRRVVAQRRCWLGYDDWTEGGNSRHWPLVKRQALSDGLFQTMVSEYLGSAHKEVIHRTIAYILMAHERVYMESQIGSAYLALESMVSGLGPDDDPEVGNILSNSVFRRLSKAIKKSLEEAAPNESVVSAMKEKLAELNRRTILEKLLVLLERYAVPVRKIWSEQYDLKGELHSIIKRRNDYIHKGTMGDLRLYYADMTRLTNLLELWALKVLDCPDEAIDDRSIQRVG